MWDDGRQLPWSEKPKMQERRLSRHVHSVDRSEDDEGRQAAALAFQCGASELGLSELLERLSGGGGIGV